jgi:hypothetical protein
MTSLKTLSRSRALFLLGTVVQAADAFRKLPELCPIVDGQ